MSVVNDRDGRFADVRTLRGGLVRGLVFGRRYRLGGRDKGAQLQDDAL